MTVKPDHFDSNYLATLVVFGNKQITLEEYFNAHFLSLAKSIEENKVTELTEISAYADISNFKQNIINFLGSKLEFAQSKNALFGINTNKVTETPRGRLICNYMQNMNPDMRSVIGSTVKSKVKEILKKNR